MNRGNKRKQQNNRPAMLIIGIVVAVILIVLIVLLIRVVIVSGSALLKNTGEAPIETQAPEEVWVSPTIEPMEEWDTGDVTPEYVPDVQENEQFDKTGEDEDSVPVDALTDGGNLFDPVDPDSGDGF